VICRLNRSSPTMERYQNGPKCLHDVHVIHYFALPHPGLFYVESYLQLQNMTASHTPVFSSKEKSKKDDLIQHCWILYELFLELVILACSNNVLYNTHSATNIVCKGVGSGCESRGIRVILLA